MVLDELGFMGAFKKSLASLRLMFAFLPVVGPWFAPRGGPPVGESNEPIE
jgi:hypothetical protein